MVRRVHKYADGGKVEHDHSMDSDYVFPKPSYKDAVVDRVKGLFTSGAAGKAAKQVDASEGGVRKRKMDKAIADASG